MKSLNVEEVTAWLEPFDPMGITIGYDAPGWAASTWVLHAMYENPSFPEHVTANAALRADAWRTHGQGRQIVDGFDLETLDLTGLERDMSYDGFSIRSQRPESPKWRRLLWRELAARLRVDLDQPDRMPTTNSFDDYIWPARIISPDQGSMDRDQFNALASALIASCPHGSGTRCIAFHPFLMTHEEPVAFSMALGELIEHYDYPEVRGSPSNIWPEDRSWMIWTGYDLEATRVNGSAELIAAVSRNDDLETLSVDL